MIAIGIVTLYVRLYIIPFKLRQVTARGKLNLAATWKAISDIDCHSVI